jgi:hypothetical protein
MAPEAGRPGSRGGDSDRSDGREGTASSGDDTAGLPPFLPSWRAFYILVIANLAFLILAFLGIQAYFA